MKPKRRKRLSRVDTIDPMAPCRGDKVFLIGPDGEVNGKETEVARLISTGVGDEEGLYEIEDSVGMRRIVEKVDYDTWIQSQP